MREQVRIPSQPGTGVQDSLLGPEELAQVVERFEAITLDIPIRIMIASRIAVLWDHFPLVREAR